MCKSIQYSLYMLKTLMRNPSFRSVKAGTGLRVSQEAPHLRKQKVFNVIKNYEQWFPHKGTDSTAFPKVKLSSDKSCYLSLTQCSCYVTEPEWYHQKLFSLQQQPQQSGKHRTPSPGRLHHS